MYGSWAISSLFLGKVSDVNSCLDDNFSEFVYDQ